MTKRILVPVLALAAFGLTARASIAVYCDVNCGGNTTAAFSSVLLLDGYSYANNPDLTFTGLGLSGNSLQYTDGLTNVMFASTNMFTITSSTLVASAGKSVTVTVPAVYAAIQLNASNSGPGFDFTCFDGGCDGTILSGTPVEVDILNNSPGSIWSFTISTTGIPSEQITINSFNPAGMQAQGSDTPEVGTLLLIGAGLISMRWMRRAQLHFFGPPQTA
jgi:hypothetical protein